MLPGQGGCWGLLEAAVKKGTLASGASKSLRRPGGRTGWCSGALRVFESLFPAPRRVRARPAEGTERIHAVRGSACPLHGRPAVLAGKGPPALPESINRPDRRRGSSRTERLRRPAAVVISNAFRPWTGSMLWPAATVCSSVHTAHDVHRWSHTFAHRLGPDADQRAESDHHTPCRHRDTPRRDRHRHVPAPGGRAHRTRGRRRSVAARPVRRGDHARLSRLRPPSGSVDARGSSATRRGRR